MRSFSLQLRLLAGLLMAPVLVQVSEAAPPVVTNVHATQAAANQPVKIFYDLQDADSATVRVSLEVSYEASPNVVVSIPATSLSGPGFGIGVKPGGSLYILWNAPADWPGQQSNKVVFRVVVNDDPIPAGMALIPAGSFQMGDSFQEGSADALLVHAVYVSAFYMDRYELAKAMWDDVRAWGLTHGYTDLPAGSGLAAKHPVQAITWYSMVKWCNARSEKEGLVPCYYTDTAQTLVYRSGNIGVSNAMVKWTVNGYRLPTEAESEKASRGGSIGLRYPWGNTITGSQANYLNSGDPYDNQTTPVGYYNGSQFPAGVDMANRYGLYDVAGNVWEWCWDWYSSTYYGDPTANNNPHGPTTGTYRVFRGGAYSRSPSPSLRCAYREWSGPSLINATLGFRCVRSQ